MRELLVGRGGDLSRLGIGLDEAAAGRGSVWLVTGEAGIGKTRLAEALADRAAARDVGCHWGRCWEGGGAPSYWPWIQILRGVLRRHPGLADAADGIASEAARASLAALVPELLPTTGDTPKLDPERERFRLFEAVFGVLVDAASTEPQVVLLEDLHAADTSSVQLLDFVARQVDGVPLLVLATYRDQDAERTAVGAMLAKVARIAHQTPLARLQEADVAELLAGRDPTITRRVYEASEGNPLFVVEVARLLERHQTSTVPLSEGIRTVIREHLATVDADTFALLQAASVLGREVRVTHLAELVSRPAQDVAVALASASEAGILETIGPDCLRFAHFLLREVLHADLPTQVRVDLHLRAAERLEAGTDPGRWSQLLVHYIDAGPVAHARALEAATNAAEHAMAQLGFGDAAEYYAKAVSLIDGDSVEARVRRAELLLRRGSAQLISGDLEEGKAACLSAAALARELERPELLARAALELGGIFVIANVDATLVRLLEEALEMLPDAPSALRAQVMARYAAAIQPAPDIDEPIAIARAAIDMARGFDDARALLLTMRSGVSAMMDLADPRMRRPFNEEYIRLAKDLRTETEVLRGHLRLAMDSIELGDAAALRASVRAAELVAVALDHPFYAWRSAALCGAEAACSGRFDEAVRHRDRAEALATAANDPSASTTLAMHRVGVELLREDDERLRAALPKLLERVGTSSLDPAFLTITVAGSLSRIEAVDDPLSRPTWRDVRAALGFRDASMLTMLADVAFAHRDVELARVVAPLVEAAPQVLVSWGLLGVCCDGPVARARGLVAATLGAQAAAVEALEEAERVATEAGLESSRARIIYELAIITGQAEHAQRARALAATLGMVGLIERIDGRDFGVVPTTSSRPQLVMEREGDVWLVRTAASSFRLKGTKGVDLLARLVADPGREHHVLDLVTDGKRSEVDAADAGPGLDDRARAQYRERLAAIQAELDEAETWADVGRAERLRSEQEALTAQLSAAFGLSGRARPTGGAAERARVNVQRRIKDAIRRIGRHDADTAKFLERAVVTGMYCKFDPA
ncbi:MAG: AAA family ATPase [Deltaproteobacteria bacterium]